MRWYHLTYFEFIPDLINICEYWLKTIYCGDVVVNRNGLYNYLIRKCMWSHYDISDPVQGIITCLYPFKKIYHIDDYMFTNNTYRYDISKVTENIGEYINWRDSWLKEYVNDYPNDYYYTNIYYDTFKPIISIVIIPFENNIEITPYDINGYIIK